MTLDEATVARIATLARIDIDDGERKRLAAELSGILDWIEQLAEVDTEGVEPLRSVIELAPRWRDDVVNDGFDPTRVASNAPKTHEGYFVVPKVVE